jgi:carboxymethylenebutenolidase
MDTFIAHPDSEGSFTPVILYMDVPGIREELRNFARRLADDGFLALLPDLYYREGKVRFDLSKGEPEFKRMFSVGGALSNAMVMRDTQGMLDYLAHSPIAKTKVGAVGYCMSGQFVISAAGTFPDRIQATASLYGTRIVTEAEDSPHKLIKYMQGSHYLGFAETDHYVEDFVVPILRDELKLHNIAHELQIHPGTDHGFCFPERPTYVADAAETAWAKMTALYSTL